MSDPTPIPTATPIRNVIPIRTGTPIRTGSIPNRSRAQRGQATAEYALVLLGAAAVALLLVAWATETGAVGRLLDSVLRSILDRI